ncbi:MAG TPA: acyloxyacyl hydrolase [Thermoanaerobaculia bacterium]|nr:acyloxyacyl hydrolase [Thermoanaerobaculia bacterium]
MIGQKALLLAAALLAALPGARPVRAEGPVMEVVPSLGQFEVFDGGRSWEAGWEARFATRRFRRLPGFLENATPVAGAMASSQGSLYAYGGFRFEHSLGERWTLTPSWAAGLYHRGTDGGKDLGGTVEFRSGVELAFRVTRRSRIGLCLYHLSNGGFYRFNPGTESLILTYGMRP